MASAPSNSILEISALALVRFMLRAMRQREMRRRIASDTEKAVLRNVGNLDWALRQNIEDAFRRFEASLTQQLSRALGETRRVMRIALEKRTARSAEIAPRLAEVGRSIETLASVLQSLSATSFR